MKNTHILMDYDNVYITLDKNYVRHDYPNLRTDVVLELHNKFKNDYIAETKLFLDFNKISLTDNEFEIFKNRHVELKHVYSGKNASDIYLMLEIMKTVADNANIEKFIIVSADSDMLPIINELRRRNKEVIVAYIEMNTDSEYIDYLKTITTDSFSIEELLGLTKYELDDWSYFERNIKLILEKINDDILKIFNEYSKFNTKLRKHIPCGTYSKKDLYKLLDGTRLVVKNDSRKCIDKLFEIGALYESNSIDGNSNFKKVLINQSYLSENDISLGSVVSEENFKDWL